MVEILREDRLIHLRNDSASYIIYLLEGGIAAHLYFGKRVEGFNPASMLRHYDLRDARWITRPRSTRPTAWAICGRARCP